MKMSKVRSLASVVTLGALSVVGAAHAALPTAVTDGIDTAEADMLTLYGVLIAAGIALWVVRLVYRHFNPK